MSGSETPLLRRVLKLGIFTMMQKPRQLLYVRSRPQSSWKTWNDLQVTFPNLLRSIGKQYDWELEKYRLGRKGIDRANKKRGFKNLLRFIKNPTGYIYWKTVRNFPTMPKTMVISFIALWVLAICQMKAYSLAVDQVDQQLLQYGKNVEGSQGRMKGFHKRTAVVTPNFWDAFFKSPLMSNQIEINPTWRQNLRKELQLTNAHNVEFWDEMVWISI